MFTGLVEETGTIQKVTSRRGSVVFTIHGRKTARGLKVDHSIAVDGVCLTVTQKRGDRFDVQAVEETLRKTTLGQKQAGDLVNLERPLRASDRFGGHFVLGHVDTTGVIESIATRRSSWMINIRIPRKFARMLTPVGSVAVDGVSLTIAELSGSTFGISIIPHTMDVTTFKEYERGRRVNVEFDVLGKYIEQLIRHRGR